MLSLVVIETLTAEGTKSAPRQTPDTSDNSRKIGLPGVQQSSELDFDRLKAKADDAKKSNQVPEAIDLFNQLLRIKPRWAEGWWYLGTLYYESDQYASGVSAFERLVALEPKNSWGWAMLGLCEYQTKEYVASLEHLAKGRSLGLGDNQELARVVRYHQAILLTRVKRFEAAQTLLNGFAVEHRESDSILDGLGMAVLRIAGPIESLTSEEREMIRQFGKAAFLAGERKMSESRKLYDELEARYQGRPNVAYAYGMLLLKQRESQRAVTYFQKELERNPKHVPAMLQIVFQGINAGKFEEGLQDAKQAVEIEPDNFAAYYALGRIYLELNEVSKAVISLEKAASLAPYSSNVQFVLARAYTRAKRPAEAARARLSLPGWRLWIRNGVAKQLAQTRLMKTWTSRDYPAIHRPRYS